MSAKLNVYHTLSCCLGLALTPNNSILGFDYWNISRSCLESVAGDRKLVYEWDIEYFSYEGERERELGKTSLVWIIQCIDWWEYCVHDLIFHVFEFCMHCSAICAWLGIICCWNRYWSAAWAALQFLLHSALFHSIASGIYFFT